MAKSSKVGDHKARRAPARRRTDKASDTSGAAVQAVEAPEARVPRRGEVLEGEMIATPAGTGRVAPAEQRPDTGSLARTDIERRAYELYVERGGEHGRDIEDWLEAERQLRRSRRG